MSVEEPLVSIREPSGSYTSPSLSSTESINALFDYKTPADSSMTNAVILMLNTAIGSGTLLVPYTYKAGIVNALLISVIFCVLAVSALWNMIDSGKATHCYDYKGLFTHVFGAKYLWIVYFIIIMVQWGCCVIYCHWNGRLLNKVIGLQGPIISNNVFWVFLQTIVLVIPLVLLKSIDKLGAISTLSTGFIGMLIVHAAYWFIKGVIKDGFDPNHQIAWFRTNDVNIAALCVNAMAYSCIVNLFPTLEHLKDCTVNRAKALSNYTLFISFILYNIFGLFTYLHLFDSLADESALEYYDIGNWFTKITTVGVVVILLASSPLVIWGARQSLMSIIFGDKKMGYGVFATVGVCMALAAAGVACASDNVLLYFDIVGGLFTPVLCFLLPSVFYLKTVKARPPYRTVLSILSLAFSVVAMITCTTQAVMKIVNQAKQ